MDVFKKLGIIVGMPSLVQEEVQKSEQEQRLEGQVVRKGYGSNPRDVLEAQLSKGGVSVPGAEEVKGMHGEEFHSDTHKESVDAATEVKEVAETDGPVKKSLTRSELLLKALDDLSEEPLMKKKAAKKGDLVDWAKEEEKEHEMDKASHCEKANKIFPVKPSLKVKQQPKDEEQKKEEKEAAIVKGELPKGISKKEFEKVANLHENSPKVAEQGKGGQPVQRKPSQFIKSQGPGGIYFDFGGVTGNPLADNATALLNTTVDPIQASIVAMQKSEMDKAMMKYIEKGHDAYTREAMGFDGNNVTDPHGALNKPMDVQVKESFEKGEFGGNNTPAPVTVKKGDTTMTLPNGEVIKGMSETDAAVIEMMKGMMGSEANTEGTVIAGVEKVTVDI